jgi:hypothetical protein
MHIFTSLPLLPSQDLECLFRVPSQLVGEPQDAYVAMQSNGNAFLFKVGGAALANPHADAAAWLD